MKMLQYERIDVSEGIDINKTSESKERIFVIIGILKTLALNFNHIVVMVVKLCQ